MRKSSARRAEAVRRAAVRRALTRREGPRACAVESLEGRVLLSATAGAARAGAPPVATPPIVVRGPVSVHVNRPATIAPHLSSPFRPADVRSAYGVGSIAWNGRAGTGAGQTIAIIDAYNDPNIVSDVATFDTQFNLQQFNTAGGPTLTVLNQNGQAGVPPANVSTATGAWDSEEALDVEWAHAIAPQANVILFEANSDDSTDLYAAIATAAAYPDVSVVSMSFGSSEFSGEKGYDSTFVTPAGHAPVTFLASTGDTNAPASYPAYSPNVVAVGGTTLSINGDGSWGGETAWGNVTAGAGGGGGVSTYEPQPTWQAGNVNNLGNSGGTARRTAPDVSMLADPNTGVYLYSSWAEGANNGTYYVAGGTSLACPMWAGLVAIADQFRAASGLAPLDGATQTLPRLYQLSSADFHDVTSGNDGFAAGAGYDLATGRGTPVAGALVPDLAGLSQPATKLVFASEPSGAAAGSALSPAVTVKVEDALGDVVTSDSSSVTLSLGNNPAGAALGGTSTVAAVNGVATFSDLSIDKAAAGYTLAASDGALTGAASSPFAITPGPAAQLAFTRQPPAGTVGVALSPGPKVAVEDAFGNVVTTDASTVTLTLGGSAGGTLASGGNTASAAASAGVATFANLAPASAGNFTLAATDARLSPAASGSFAVAKATPAVTATDAGGTYTGSAFGATAAAVRDAATGAPVAGTGDPALSYAYYAGTLTSPSAVAAATPLPGAPASAGSYTVVANFAGSANYLPAQSAPVNFRITPRPLHVTALGQGKTYDGTTAATVTLADDRVAGDVLTTGYAAAAFTGKDAGAAVPIHVTGLTLGGADAGNYVLAATTAAATATIAPRSVTGSVTAADKTYDGTTAAQVAGTSLTGVLPGDAVTLGGGAASFDGKDVTAATVTAVGLALIGPQAGDYALANPTESAPAAITPRPVTGSVAASDKVFDGTAAATLTRTSLAGVLDGDAVQLAGGAASFDTPAVGTGKTVMATGLTLSGPQSADYALSNPTETATASVTPLGIAGSVFNDAAGDAGLAGRTVSLLPGGSTKGQRLTRTDAQGNFSFSNLAPGSYVLRVQTPAGWRPTTAPAAGAALTLVGGQPLTGLQFGQTTTASLAGHVLLNAAGLSGWTVLLTPAAKSSSSPFTAATDAAGAYTFPAVPAGPYRLSVAQPPGYAPAAKSPRTVSIKLAAGKMVVAQNFLERLLTAARHRRGRKGR